MCCTCRPSRAREVIVRETFIKGIGEGHAKNDGALHIQQCEVSPNKRSIKIHSCGQKPGHVVSCLQIEAQNWFIHPLYHQACF